MNNLLPKACAWNYSEIPAGMKQQRDYVISPELYQTFLLAFDDRSPIHVDEAYAVGAGFSGKVMHGAILNGFLSHFVGMFFPGRSSMLLSVDLRFAHPSYLGDVIQLETVVSQKLDTNNVLVLSATFTNATQNYIAARGRVQVLVREETK